MFRIAKKTHKKKRFRPASRARRIFRFGGINVVIHDIGVIDFGVIEFDGPINVVLVTWSWSCVRGFFVSVV